MTGQVPCVWSCALLCKYIQACEEERKTRFIILPLENSREMERIKRRSKTAKRGAGRTSPPSKLIIKIVCSKFYTKWRVLYHMDQLLEEENHLVARSKAQPRRRKARGKGKIQPYFACFVDVLDVLGCMGMDKNYEGLYVGVCGRK